MIFRAKITFWFIKKFLHPQKNFFYLLMYME
ncbi:hypothetical protein FSU_0153 [Fibrobacter succinogenes subsp. succinogenes S85]|uniref:Uncharacterized protein n=1 Tax=Fibrobacter succinogenes (strain ATCC 19169 / S85) TaxID=59374 RepID=D9S4Y6_FIBSS|nr:hypothetical protein FSU_0153 [Fibrobacter succinogenes subsp. succinogenes S85]